MDWPTATVMIVGILTAVAAWCWREWLDSRRNAAAPPLADAMGFVAFGGEHDQ